MPVGVQQQVFGVTVQKTAVSPQLQFIGKVVDFPIVAQRQISMVPSVQNSIDSPVARHGVDDLCGRRHPCRDGKAILVVLAVKKTIEIPEFFVDMVIDVLVVRVVQVPQVASWRRQPRSHSCRSLRKIAASCLPRQCRNCGGLRSCSSLTRFGRPCGHAATRFRALAVSGGYGGE